MTGCCRLGSLAESWSLAGISWPWPFLRLLTQSSVALCGRGLRSLVVLGPHRVQKTRQWPPLIGHPGLVQAFWLVKLWASAWLQLSRMPRLLTRIYNLTKLWWFTQNERNWGFQILKWPHSALTTVDLKVTKSNRYVLYTIESSCYITILWSPYHLLIFPNRFWSG